MGKLQQAPFAVSICMTNSRKNSWSPARTLVFIVGVLEWKKANIHGYPKWNRRDEQLFEHFKKMGVPSRKIVYLADKDATLKNIKQKLNEILELSTSRDTLIFYYCGHGDLDKKGNGVYMNYDYDEKVGGLTAKFIASTIKKKFSGSNAIFLGDCCSSGAIASSLASSGLDIDFAVLASAFPGISSTGNWTFTQSVLDGLRGHSFVDRDKDGLITFDELARYVNAEMWSIEKQHMYVYATKKLRSDFVMTAVKQKTRSSTKLVEAKVKRRWWKAKLLRTKEGEAKIRWCQIGSDSQEDECWKSLSEIREIALAKVSPKLKKGDSLQVLWGGRYYKASVLGVQKGLCYVHYDGFESYWDEWVDNSRIKSKPQKSRKKNRSVHDA